MASLFQFSVRSLLLGVTILAIGVAALASANDIWQGLIWGLALYALAVSILMVVYRREEARAYWLGFGVCGGLYLLLLFCSEHNWLSIAAIRYDRLLATQLARWSHQALLPESRRAEYVFITVPPPPRSANGTSPGIDPMGTPGLPYGVSGGTGMMSGGMGDPFGASGPPGSTVPTNNPNYVPLDAFTHIFHALALLAAAAIGGMTCQFIYRTRPRTEH